MNLAVQFVLGNRDIVGYGVHGNPEYFDREEVPFPGVRFLANTPEVLKLRQKETGDWTKLSLEDKKACMQHDLQRILCINLRIYLKLSSSKIIQYYLYTWSTQCTEPASDRPSQRCKLIRRAIGNVC